jgi:tetraacyldisaccharide 4'-kinase
MRNDINHRISSWLLRNWYTLPATALPGPARALLRLGAGLYATGLHHHQRQARQRRRQLPAFVISVGNLVVGGAGKTPMTLWLAHYLRSTGWNPAILSRGYRRKDAAVAKVPLTGPSFQGVRQFGDEPVLMARKVNPVPIWVGKDRWQSGSLAVQNDHADTLILDDGFQHLALERNLDLVLLDAHNPFGNGALLPLGPLREPPAHLERADAIVLTRAEDPEKSRETRSKLAQWFPGKPVFSCIHRLTGFTAGLDAQSIPLAALHGKAAVAFAAIARPESFYKLLRAAGIGVSRSFAFPDHHQYHEADMAMLMKAVKESHAAFLITTEKDMVRLLPEYQALTLATAVDIDFLAEHQAFCSFLRNNLPSR